MLTILGWWPDGVPSRVVVQWQRPVTIGGAAVLADTVITYDVKFWDHIPTEAERDNPLSGTRLQLVDEIELDTAARLITVTKWLYFGFRATATIGGTDYADDWWWSFGDPTAPNPHL